MKCISRFSVAAADEQNRESEQAQQQAAAAPCCMSIVRTDFQPGSASWPCCTAVAAWQCTPDWCWHVHAQPRLPACSNLLPSPSLPVPLHVTGTLGPCYGRACDHVHPSAGANDSHERRVG